MEFIELVLKFFKENIFVVVILSFLLAIISFLRNKKNAERADNASAPKFDVNGSILRRADRMVEFSLVNQGERTEIIGIEGFNKNIQWSYSKNPFHTHLDNGSSITIKGKLDDTYPTNKIAERYFEVDIKMTCKHKNGKRLSYRIKGFSDDYGHNIKVV